MKAPETYNELIRQKSVLELKKYYPLSEEIINEIYNFLSENIENTIQGTKKSILLKNSTGIVKTINIIPSNSWFSSIEITNNLIKVVPLNMNVKGMNTYGSRGSSFGGSGSSHSSFGGSSGFSSNNNNNNNKTNVRNKCKDF